MLEELLEALRTRRCSVTVFNQYADENRLNNLRLFLLYLLKGRPDVLLLGEAPGYRGCRITGIPFTSGAVIEKSKHRIFQELGEKIKLERVEAEATASVFWEFIGEDRHVPVLWNAFPFHPHLVNCETNRRPTRSELDEGKQYLYMVFRLFRPRRLVSLGRVGQAILGEAFPGQQIKYIRHPSHGGKNAFNRGMTQLWTVK
jgi:uracil-DNA glycosylase